jgi:hypothetical protein
MGNDPNANMVCKSHATAHRDEFKIEFTKSLEYMLGLNEWNVHPNVIKFKKSYAGNQSLMDYILKTFVHGLPS